MPFTQKQQQWQHFTTAFIAATVSSLWDKSVFLVASAVTTDNNTMATTTTFGTIAFFMHLVNTTTTTTTSNINNTVAISTTVKAAARQWFALITIAIILSATVCPSGALPLRRPQSAKNVTPLTVEGREPLLCWVVQIQTHAVLCGGHGSANTGNSGTSACWEERQRMVAEHSMAVSMELGLEIHHTFGQFQNHLLLCHNADTSVRPGVLLPRTMNGGSSDTNQNIRSFSSFAGSPHSPKLQDALSDTTSADSERNEKRLNEKSYVAGGSSFDKNQHVGPTPRNSQKGGLWNAIQTQLVPSPSLVNNSNSPAGHMERSETSPFVSRSTVPDVLPAVLSSSISQLGREFQGLAKLTPAAGQHATTTPPSLGQATFTSTSASMAQLYRLHSDLRVKDKQLFDFWHQRIEARLTSHPEVVTFSSEHVHRRKSRLAIPPRQPQSFESTAHFPQLPTPQLSPSSPSTSLPSSDSSSSSLHRLSLGLMPTHLLTRTSESPTVSPQINMNAAGRTHLLNTTDVHTDMHVPLLPKSFIDFSAALWPEMKKKLKKTLNSIEKRRNFDGRFSIHQKQRQPTPSVNPNKLVLPISMTVPSLVKPIHSSAWKKVESQSHSQSPSRGLESQLPSFTSDSNKHTSAFGSVSHISPHELETLWENQRVSSSASGILSSLTKTRVKRDVIIDDISNDNSSNKKKRQDNESSKKSLHYPSAWNLSKREEASPKQRDSPSFLGTFSKQRVLSTPPEVPGISDILGVFKRRRRRSEINSMTFNDPAYPRQWHLYNRASPGMDINVTDVWRHNITGRGVTVAVVDDGVEWRNPDLQANYNPDGSWDLNDDDPDPSPSYAKVSNHHGTRCAGEIAAVANNNVCGVGVAYGAKIAGVRVLDGVMTDSMEAEAFNKNMDVNAIFSCSWGPDDDGATVDGPHLMAAKAMKFGVDFGRGGFGSVFVVASGNGGENGDNCNFDGYANSIYTVTIGAVDEDGGMPYYAEECASMLGVTFSSGTLNKRDIVTTDWSPGDNVGDSGDGGSAFGFRSLGGGAGGVGAPGEASAGTSQGLGGLSGRSGIYPGSSGISSSGKGGGCTERHTGTSAAAPLAAGMIALMLEARPCLTWRDVQYVVALTARKVDVDVAHWQDNGAGLSHSHKHGFGLLSAWRLVNAARIWQTVPWLTSYSVTDESSNWQIPKGKRNPLTIVQPVTQKDIRGLSLFILEHVQLTVWLSHPWRGKVEVKVVSPAGTVSVLAATRHKDNSSNGFSDWTFTTVRCWGETPTGNWTILIFDHDEHSRLDQGTLTKYRLTLFGTPMTSEEFAQRRLAVEAAMTGEFLQANYSLHCPPPPQYESVYAPVSERTLKIIILSGIFLLVMALYETFEYMFCYDDEKKEARRTIKLARRAARMAEEAMMGDATEHNPVLTEQPQAGGTQSGAGNLSGLFHEATSIDSRNNTSLHDDLDEEDEEDLFNISETSKLLSRNVGGGTGRGHNSAVFSQDGRVAARADCSPSREAIPLTTFHVTEADGERQGVEGEGHAIQDASHTLPSSLKNNDGKGSSS